MNTSNPDKCELAHAFFSSPCPKENCFQTRSCFFLLDLSEGELLSDSFLLFSSFPCPKENCFQTRSCFFLLALSEGDSLSDSILLFPPPPVRRRTAFRLDLAFS